MEHNLSYINVRDVEIFSGRKVDFQLSYQTFGKNYNSYPVVVINHSLTGNSNVTGKDGWWNNLVGDNKLIDTKKYAVLSFNIPGNCFGNELNDYYK